MPGTHSRETLNGSALTPAERPRLLRLGALLAEWEADAIAAHLAYTTGTPRGPITSLPSLDRELGGALAPGVHVLHAGPGVGKTAFALQVASLSPFPALYLTAEMGALELFRRITARHLNVPRSAPIRRAGATSVARAGASSRGGGTTPDIGRCHPGLGTSRLDHADSATRAGRCVALAARGRLGPFVGRVRASMAAEYDALNAGRRSAAHRTH